MNTKARTQQLSAKMEHGPQCQCVRVSLRCVFVLCNSDGLGTFSSSYLWFLLLFTGAIHSCGEPPQIPHAVILQKYQDLFPEDSEVQYQCEVGYALQGGDNKMSIFCIMGNWSLETDSDLPTCSKWTACYDVSFFCIKVSNHHLLSKEEHTTGLNIMYIYEEYVESSVSLNTFLDHTTVSQSAGAQSWAFSSLRAEWLDRDQEKQLTTNGKWLRFCMSAGNVCRKAEDMKFGKMLYSNYHLFCCPHVEADG